MHMNLGSPTKHCHLPRLEKQWLRIVGAVMLLAWQDMAFWLATVGVAYVIHFFPFGQLLESLAGG